MKEVLNYRIAYMKAISMAWSDESFKDKFLNSENVLDFLSSTENKKIFNNYKNPWDFLKITVSNHYSMKWSPEKTSGWIGQNDCIEIYLPEKPEDSTKAAEALIQYYYLFPSFLGPLKDQENELNNGNISGGSVSSKMGLGDDIIDFGSLMMRIISLSWQDDTFLDELFTSSGLSESADTDCKSDSSQILAKYFAYTNPWNFNIRFRKASEFKYEEVGGVYKWSNIPKNHIHLWFPNSPENIESEPTALTSYHDNGSAYPFTCT